METACLDPALSTYLYVEPFGSEPASVAVVTNGLKGYFPFKGQTTVGSWGRNASSYQLLHKLNLGLCTECLCVYVCVCMCVCVSGHTVKSAVYESIV